MRKLIPQIVSTLKEIDGDDSFCRKGHLPGLYAQFEPQWSKELEARLKNQGLSAKSECRYPNPPARGGRKCDVVIDLPNEQRLWLEIKGAFKHYWGKNDWIYRSYLFHPLLPGLDETKTHTAALDLEKLQSIRADDGTHVGLIIVGFDGENAISADVEQFTELAGLRGSHWATYHNSWQDSHRAHLTVHCWSWIREIE